MKKSELITANYDAILETMIDRYAKVINAAGRIQYDIYIWSDGEIEVAMLPQGDHSYLKPYDSETRELYFITTVSEPFYDPRDQIIDPLPDDEDEQKAIFAEVDEWMVDQYRQGADERLDAIIEETEREEAYDA